MSKARNLSKVIVDSSGIVDRDSLDVETVAKTGSYNDLTNKPTIPSGTVTSVAASAGTGISVSGSPITSSGTITITNTAPDQTVALTAGTGISTSGTYPNFTITNSAPDQTVALTQGGTTTITGTYPNFTISSADQYVGTVTSVAATVPTGLSVSGTPVTSSGTLAITYAAGYSIPTDAKQTNWDTAYGWGNHASAGYATYPSQTGNTGKFLTTDGSATSWAEVDALPDQTGNSGKYLTTDGTDASWATITANPALDDLSDVTITSPTTGQVLSYNGTAWVNSSSSGTRTTYETLATANQTTFSATYTPGFLDVYLNGSKLVSTDYTATNGTSVVFNNSCSLNDEVIIVAYGTFSVADTYTQAEVDDLIDSIQTGGAIGDIFYENAQAVTANYTITSGKNAMSAGPITINSGVTVTVPADSTWVVV